MGDTKAWNSEDVNSLDFADALTSQIFVGLSRAMVMFVVAAGLTVVLGVLRVVNFAHGVFYMLGAFLAFSLANWLADVPGGFWITLVVAPLGVAALCLVIERLLLRKIYGKEHLLQLLLTYALVLIFGDLIRIVWGSSYKSLAVPEGLSGAINLFGSAIPKYNMVMLVVGPLVAVGLWYFFSRSRLGKIVRATASDREMVNVLGINSFRVFALVFCLGGYLAGLGGSLIAPTTNIVQGMDVGIIVKAFLIVVLGGLGNIWGTLLAALIFGLGESLGILFMPQLGIVFPFLIATLILIIRPTGLLKSVW